MGNKYKNSTPTQKTQAIKVLPTGNPDGLSIGGYKENTIRIKLVRLNLMILSQIRLLDPVTVVWKDNGFFSFLNNQILGKVPANYNNQLRFKDVHPAIIVKLDIDLQIVIIEII